MFEPPPAPEPLAHLPVPQFTPNMSGWAGGGRGIPGDALAAFNQKVMKTPLSPLHLLLSSSLCGLARRSDVPFLVFPCHFCNVACCGMLIYANKPCLPLPLPPSSVCVFVSALPASSTPLPPGILETMSGMYSPKRISSFTGNFDYKSAMQAF